MASASPDSQPRTAAPKTRERVLDAALELFNEHGFANTTIAQIAEHEGIAVGNLWYHFRAKQDLVLALIERAEAGFYAVDQEARKPIPVLKGHIEFMLGAIQVLWQYRFLLRDRLELGSVDPIVEMREVADSHFALLRHHLERMKRERLFRGTPPDLDVLATNLWIVVRHWLDHLEEREGVTELTWDHQMKGFHQHLAILTPHLSAAARRSLEKAEVALTHKIRSPQK